VSVAEPIQASHDPARQMHVKADEAVWLFDRIASHGDSHGERRASAVPGIGRLAVALALVDLAAIALGFGSAVLIADTLRTSVGIVQIEALQFVAQRGHELILLSALAIGIFAFGGLYRRNRWEVDEVRRIVAGVALLAMFDAMLQYSIRDHNSRLWFGVAYPMVALSVVSCRAAFRTLTPVREAITTHVILLGSGIPPDLLIFELRESRSNPVRLLRSLDFSEIELRNVERLDEMLHRISDLAGVPEHRVQIVLAPAPEEIASAQAVMDLLNALHRPHGIILPFNGLARHGLSLQKVLGADIVMAEMQPMPATGVIRPVKRLFDLVASALGLLVLLPVLVIVSVLLLLEGGPVFFTQMRLGRNGRRFRCFKFRTMRPDAEERLQELLEKDPKVRAEWAKYQKLQDDPRVTPLGQFLRRTSLDELPQLINVLIGEMSLVGPRPIVAPEVPGYPNDRAYSESPDFAYYLRCTPGLTGLWQVFGRSTTMHEERIRLDRWYARNHSIWLDLVILFKTVRVVLFRTGSI
jgi:undecaprenyl-phosphate galactose phosphotransferase